MDELLRFVVYDKENLFVRDFIVDGSADVACNGVSTAEFILDDDDPALPAVTADGARCAVWFRGVELFRGAITATPGEGPSGTVTARVDSDLRKLWHWLAWPVPGAALNAQNVEYRRISGLSEYVFKTALAENLTRLGVGWVVAADNGLGSSVAVDLRFHYLGDKVLPLVDADQLIVTISYDSAGVPTVDVVEPGLVAGKLTLASGVPDSYKFDRAWPTATRAIVGGRGEGVAREFKTVIDSTREAAWGDVIETFVDARNSDESSDITPDAQAAVDEGAPRVSVATELVETDRFRYLTTYQVGDLVNVAIGPVDVTEQIRQVSITSSFEDGTVVTPTIGDVDADDTDVQLVRQVARLAKGLRDQGRR